MVRGVPRGIPKPRYAVVSVGFAAIRDIRRWFLRGREGIDFAGTGRQFTIVPTDRRSSGKGNEFPQDSVFQLEFDAVSDGLKHHLDCIVADKFDGYNGNVQDQDQNVDQQ